MFGDSLTVADTLLISGFSILSVFLVLLLLSYMIDFCAFLVKRSENLPETGTGTAAPAANDSSDVLLAAAAVCLWSRMTLWCAESEEWKTAAVHGLKVRVWSPYDK